MKTIQVKKARFLAASIAIATSAVLCQPAQAKNPKVHEIGWSSRLSSMGLNKPDNLGNKYTFYCQPASEDLIHAPIWGTDSYTPNSGICTTAVHAGMLKAEDGGEVTIELLEGQAFYTGSYKNEVTSQDRGDTKMSFTFVGEKITKESAVETEAEANHSRRSSGIEKVMVQGVEKGIERSIEKVIIDIFK